MKQIKKFMKKLKRENNKRRRELKREYSHICRIFEALKEKDVDFEIFENPVLYGSVYHETNTTTSDMDILLEIPKTKIKELLYSKHDGIVDLRRRISRDIKIFLCAVNPENRRIQYHVLKKRHKIAGCKWGVMVFPDCISTNGERFDLSVQDNDSVFVRGGNFKNLGDHYPVGRDVIVFLKDFYKKHITSRSTKSTKLAYPGGLLFELLVYEICKKSKRSFNFSDLLFESVGVLVGLRMNQQLVNHPTFTFRFRNNSVHQFFVSEFRKLFEDIAVPMLMCVQCKEYLEETLENFTSKNLKSPSPQCHGCIAFNQQNYYLECFQCQESLWANEDNFPFNQLESPTPYCHDCIALNYRKRHYLMCVQCKESLPANEDYFTYKNLESPTPQCFDCNVFNEKKKHKLMCVQCKGSFPAHEGNFTPKNLDSPQPRCHDCVYGK